MSKKKYLLISILFLLGCNRQPDKMQNIIKSQDSLGVFFDLANSDNLTREQRRIYIEKALGIISLQLNDSLNRVNYFKVANRYYNINDLGSYKKITEKIKNASIEKKDSSSLAKAHMYIGDYYSAKFISDSAYKSYLRAEKIYLNLGDHTKVAKNLLSKCILQFNEKDYVGSEKSALEALKHLRETTEFQLKYDAFNLLGIIYNELSEFEKALEYHRKALNEAENTNPPDKALIFSSIHNIGLVYQNNNNDLKAVEYFEKALTSYKELNRHSQDYAILLDNLGYSKLRLKNYNNLPILFYKALRISDSLKSLPNMLSNKIHISEYYLEERDTASANRFAIEAYLVAKTNKIDKYRLLALKQLLTCNPNKSMVYSNEYIKINDSLQLVERQTRNKLGRIEYETDQLATDKANLVEQRRTLIYIALGIILIGLFVFVIRSQAAKNRELRLLREQQAANEEIYRLMISQQQQRDEGRQLEKKRIARELHDGVMGQLTAIRMNLFPLGRKQDPETIRECLPHIDKIRQVEQEIRSIAYDLDSPLTDSADFTEVIHTIFTGLEQHSGIRFLLQADASIDWQSVPVDTKVQLYRILQEALQNIVKYAKAGKVTVDISLRDSVLWMSVQDNGIGFDLKLVRKGLGLRNMQQRAEDLSGTMTVHTAPGQGTSLEFLLPLNNGL